MAEIFRSLAFAVARSLDHDLPTVKFMRPKYNEQRERTLEEAERRPHDGDIEVYHFPQTWSDTSLGFGGVAGQAFTTAYTTVVICDPSAAVYFAGRLAYVIQRLNDSFMEDLRAHNMAEVRRASRYRGEVAR